MTERLGFILLGAIFAIVTVFEFLVDFGDFTIGTAFGLSAAFFISAWVTDA